MTEKSVSRKITQELNRLQVSLTSSLEKFYNQKIKGSQLPPETIKQKYGKEIEDIIRNRVQSSWLFSHDIIKDQTGQTVFISSKDGAGMEKASKKMVDQFWTTSGKIWLRENEYKVDNKNNQLVELDQFDMHAGMVGIGLLVVYYAYNQGMFSKSQELGNVKLKFVTRENCIDTQICLPLNGNIYNAGEVPFELPLHRHCKCRLIPVRV
jgi:hypothetical protein